MSAFLEKRRQDRINYYNAEVNRLLLQCNYFIASKLKSDRDNFELSFIEKTLSEYIDEFNGKKSNEEKKDTLKPGDAKEKICRKLRGD